MQSKTRCHREVYGVFKVFVMWLLLKNNYASFKSSGIIYWSLPPSSLSGELLMDKIMASFLLTSNRSNETAGSSLIVAHWWLSFWHAINCRHMNGTHDTAAYCAITCNVHSCDYSLANYACNIDVLWPCKQLVVILLDMQYCSVHLRQGFCTIVFHCPSVATHFEIKLNTNWSAAAGLIPEHTWVALHCNM